MQNRAKGNHDLGKESIYGTISETFGEFKALIFNFFFLLQLFLLHSRISEISTSIGEVLPQLVRY